MLKIIKRAAEILVKRKLTGINKTMGKLLNFLKRKHLGTIQREAEQTEPDTYCQAAACRNKKKKKRRRHYRKNRL